MNNTNQPNATYIDFGYFMEGPRSAWTRLFQQALLDDVGLDVIRGSRVLNMGARDGRVASCLALLGAAHIMAIDSPDIDLSQARTEVQKHGVADRVELHYYDGHLSQFEEGSFDLIVTKSALVVEADLDGFLSGLSNKLAKNGTVIFLENAKGGRVVEFLRAMRHRKWGYSRANMFTDNEVQRVRHYFNVVCSSKSRWPPVYKIVGRKVV